MSNCDERFAEFPPRIYRVNTRCGRPNIPGRAAEFSPPIYRLNMRCRPFGPGRPRRPFSPSHPAAFRQQDLALADMVGLTDHALVLHFLDAAGGAVVADLQV